tara:strand:- start:86 stop:601 length:516 start_codon:yes stop_codon:yes gene_type:complete
MKFNQLTYRAILIIFLCLPLSFANSNEKNDRFSFYVGTFDVIDKENDDKTTLFGFEHNNTNLSKDTFIGKFSPISGGFLTKKDSFYLYTGVQIEYQIGFLKITPSFAPGYYDKGQGKDLGSALEFKSEIKLGFETFKNIQVDYSYSHISNNDWGRINPGANNETISFTIAF